MNNYNCRVQADANASFRVAQGGLQEQPMLEEAWAIAIELRRDLGLAEAIVWADAYLEDVREHGSSAAVARWAVVISALTELAHAKVH